MFSNNLLAGVSGQGGEYAIEDSLRFNDNDSAYLSRTPSVAGNRKTWTFSGWVKRGNLGITQVLFSCETALLRFESTDKIFFYDNGITVYESSSALYRDVSGWYHVVFVYDTTNATTENRLRLWVNGEETTFTGGVAPLLNYESSINKAVTHTIGCNQFTTTQFLDGYLAEINFIDGQALTADDFGEINADTGEWSPIPYAGTYGTNGFYLEFEDGAALGDDTSGNTNDWTPTNLASTDQMLDTPTNNFSTLNPLTTTMTLSEGNLKETTNVTNNWQSAINTLGVSSGKWYFETCAPQALNSPPYAAIGITTNPNFGTKSGNNYLGNSADSWGYISDGDKYTSAIGTSYGTTYTNGDVIGCALDMDAGTITFYKNNVSQGVAYTGLTGTMFCGACSYAASGTTSNNINFGQDSSFAGNKTRQGNKDANGKGDFYYTPPAGYLALCTDNLPTLAIEQPETQFNVVTYTGTSTTVGDNQLVTGVGFQPDLVWIKNRGSATDFIVADSLRYVSITNNNTLNTNTTSAEADDQNRFRGFDSDGFNVGYYAVTGLNGNSYVAWCWKAGGTAVTNTDGTITSQVSANVDAGFSIVSYTGNSTSGATIGHGLNSAPEVVIAKTRTISNSWHVYTKETGAANVLVLDSTAALYTGNAAWWNNTDPNSTVVTLGSGSGTNSSSAMIAYCFHSVEGFSKFGSYTGNGSTNGPFVYTGFRPAFVIVKATSATGGWRIFDNKRSAYNLADESLAAHLSNAESTVDGSIDMLSNGFKFRAATLNTSGETYIYMAFAESPTKFSLGR